jgi:hypothetical protein
MIRHDRNMMPSAIRPISSSGFCEFSGNQASVAERRPARRDRRSERRRLERLAWNLSQTTQGKNALAVNPAREARHVTRMPGETWRASSSRSVAHGFREA